MPTADAGSEASVVALARSAMAAGMAALAANDHDAALRWLDRAHRLVPSDPNAALSLASACLTRNPARSAALFAEVAAKYDVRQAWLGLAAARLRLTDRAAAADALARALSRHVLKDETASLARQITASGGSAGWCGLRSDGRLEAQVVNGDRVRASLDGKPLRGLRLPAGWQHGSRIDVQAGDRSLLGSPIRIDAIRRGFGCGGGFRGGLRGWGLAPGGSGRAGGVALAYRDGRPKQR